MSKFDASDGDCFIYTYKEGLLSTVAHDLKIQVERFEIDIDPETMRVSAKFEATSLRVLCAMKDDTELQGSISAKDCAEIEVSIVKDVLHTKAHPLITFESSSVRPTVDGYDIVGILKLHGKEKSIQAKAKSREGELVVEFVLNQPDFGIKPYSALLGTLKVKSEVRVFVSVPRL